MGGSGRSGGSMSCTSVHHSVQQRQSQTGLQPQGEKRACCCSPLADVTVISPATASTLHPNSPSNGMARVNVELDDMRAGAASTGSGSERDPPRVAAAAAALCMPSILKSAALSGEVQSRLIEWAAPAPGWLLAVSSGAFFLLAFFAFSQYRRRATRTLNSEEGEGAALSTSSRGSSGPAPTSLPGASGQGVLGFFFPAVSYRVTETTVGATPLHAHAERPVPPVGPFSAVRGNVFLNDISAAHSCATAAAPAPAVAAAACSARVSSGAAERPAGSAAAGSTGARSASAGAARRTYSAANEAVAAGADFGDAAHDNSSQVRSSAAAAPHCPTGGIGARGVIGKIAHAGVLEASSASSSSISGSPPSSPWSTAMPLLNVKVASTVAGATANTLLRHAGGSVACCSVEGQLSSKDDRSAAVAARRAAEEKKASCYFFTCPPPLVQTAGSEEQNAALRCVVAATGNSECGCTPPPTPATAVSFSAAVATLDCIGSLVCGTSACTASAGFAQNARVAGYNLSPATCASSAMRRPARSCRSGMTCSSRDSLRDYCASPPLLMRAREVVLHGVTIRRPRGRDFSAQSVQSPDRGKEGYDSPATKQGYRTPTEVSVGGEIERRGVTATATRDGTALKTGLRAAADGVAESVAAQPGNTPGPVEEVVYSSLAVDEEDLPAAPCAGRSAFAFDGASTRSWILAIVGVAALLRALLLLLQLVANPLEGTGSTTAAGLQRVRPSVLPESSILWHGPSITETHDEVEETERTDAPSAFSNRRLSVVGVHSSHDRFAMFAAPSAGSAGSQAFLRSAGLRSVETLSPAATSSLEWLRDSGGVITSDSLPKRLPGGATSVRSSLVQWPPAASFDARSSSLSCSRGTCGGRAAVAGMSERLSPADRPAPSTTILPAAKSSVSLLQPPLHPVPLQSLRRTPSPTTAAQRRTLLAEAAAVSKAITSAARNTPVVFLPATAYKAEYRHTLPGYYDAALLPGTGETPAAAPVRAAAPAGATASITENVKGRGNALKNHIPNATHGVGTKRHQGVSTAGGHTVECDTSLSSSATRYNSSDLPLTSGREGSRNLFFNSSDLININGYSLTSEGRKKPTEVSTNKGTPPRLRRGSSRKEGRRRMALKTKGVHANSSRSRQSTHIPNKRTHVKRSSPSTTLPRSSGSSRAGRGRMGWPSAWWLRTLARSLPPMLCLEAYAVLIQFLMDLFCASSRLENVRWIAVGSYIFRGGVWVLFVSIAGLTVAEDSRRREAAHLFARSVCCLLGFCFTLLSVSLTVVGTLVLRQLRGRASTHLFFPPCVIVRHPASESDTSLRPAAAADLYCPPRGGPHFGATFRGSPTACRSAAAWKEDTYRCALTGKEHCHTHRDRKQHQSASTGGRYDSWLPAWLKRHCFRNLSRAAVAAATVPEQQRDHFSDAAAGTRHPWQSQQQTSTQRTCPLPLFSWGEQQQQQRLLEEDVHGWRQARRITANPGQRRSLAPLPEHLFYLTYCGGTEDVEPSPRGPSSVPLYSSAWRRLFMLTLCCPPLLMMRGVHLLLVGVQIFPHYYPFFVEEKGTFDVLMYLITEWLPLTLLVCALSKTAPSRRDSNNAAAQATLLVDAHNTARCAVQSSVLHPVHPLFHCRSDCRDSSGMSELPCRLRSKGSAGAAATACSHQPYCPLSMPTYTAAVRASRVQPQLLEQHAVEGGQHDVEKQHAVKETQHTSLCNGKKKQRRMCSVAFSVNELASPTSLVSSTKMRKWKRLLYYTGKANSHLHRESNWSVKSYDEQFQIPLLTKDVLSGSEALRLAQQQHGSSSSSSNISRRDSERRRCGAEPFRTFS